MTQVPSNPVARYERLLLRANEVHEKVVRLVDDLAVGEGLAAAEGALESLSALCLVLEGKANGGQ
jgi:hypothetical protein